MNNDLALTDFDIEFGPAMRALRSDRQRNFAVGLVMLGLTQVGAAKYAGYTDGSARDHASDMARHPLMQDAIEELARTLVKTDLPANIRILQKIRDNDQADESVRAKIAFGLMDRAGLSTETKHTVTVAHKAMSERELTAEFERLADKFNLSPLARRELLNPPKVVDAEFHTVGPEKEPAVVATESEEPKQPVDGREGLGDVL